MSVSLYLFSYCQIEAAECQFTLPVNIPESNEKEWLVLMFMARKKELSTSLEAYKIKDKIYLDIDEVSRFFSLKSEIYADKFIINLVLFDDIT